MDELILTDTTGATVEFHIHSGGKTGYIWTKRRGDTAPHGFPITDDDLDKIRRFFG